MTVTLSDPGPGQPFFSSFIVPDLPSLALSEGEKNLISLLQTRQWVNRTQMLLHDAYYRGEQVINDLGIAIPPELSGLRTLVGWPRIAVDPITFRLFVEGFRLPNATDSDADLGDLWTANRMGGEQALAFKDALVKGRGYFTIGSPLDGDDFPAICVESPLNMTVQWDVRSMKPKAALQTYWMDNQQHAALYTPEQTVHLGRDDITNQWEITDRDEHGFGLVPIVRMANEPESDRRDGRSEITPEVMSIVDAGCRTMLGLEVAREFYSVPQKYILGATEADFQNADGTPRSAFKTYISNILAIEADEAGETPTVGQFKPVDPSVFTKIIEMYASQMAGILGAPPQDLGLYTQGNPISAEAQQVSESRRDRYARHKQQHFGTALIATMQIASRFMNGGEVPDKYRRMEVDWMPPEQYNPTGISDAITKQIETGAIPATSDVTLKRLGYNPVERQRLADDRALDQGQSFLLDVAHSLTAKAARTDKALTGDVSTPAATPTPTPKDVFGGKQGR